jgi:hypothetical protein
MRDTLSIKEHMAVIGADGTRLGTVDHLEGEDRIKLTRSGSDDDRHHYIPTDWVDHIDEHVHLNLPSDEARRLWQ